jgi:hypothetical protein
MMYIFPLFFLGALYSGLVFWPDTLCLYGMYRLLTIVYMFGTFVVYGWFNKYRGLPLLRFHHHWTYVYGLLHEAHFIICHEAHLFWDLCVWVCVWVITRPICMDTGSRSLGPPARPGSINIGAYLSLGPVSIIIGTYSLLRPVSIIIGSYSFTRLVSIIIGSYSFTRPV